MRFATYLIAISVGVCLTGANVCTNGALFFSLIKRIRNYYSSSAVVFAQSSNGHKDVDVLIIRHLTHTLCRMLERENIATLSVTFENMVALSKLYDNIVRPLIVVLLPSPMAYYEFSKATKSFKMSFSAWFVMFLSTPTGNATHSYCYNRLGNPFHLSFNSEMLTICPYDFILREWYSVDGNSTETFELAEWRYDGHSMESVEKIDVLTNLSLHERRNNMKGTVLRGVTVQSSILLTVKDNKVHGYLGKVISELENALNFTIEIVADVMEYGSFNATSKRWSGAMWTVISGQADIGVSDFSMTNIRLDYVDYTIPLLTTRNCLILKQPEFFAVKWFAYYKTFSFAVWVSIFATVLIAQLVLAFIRSCTDSHNMPYAVYEEFLRIWGIFCQQGLSEFPRNSSLRIAYFTMFITAIVTSAAYSAALICFLTARITTLPFRTIEEFVKDGSYSIIVTKDSADYDLIANSNDPLSASMMKLMKPLEALPIDVQTGFKHICNDDKLAFYSGYNVEMQKRSIVLNVPCKVVVINDGRVNSLAMILSKGNQYTSVLNYHLQKLLSTGVLNRFKSEVYFQKETKFKAVGFGSVVPVLMVFFSGAVLAFLILVVEIWI